MTTDAGDKGQLIAVAIGASAGGVEALEAFFDHMDDHCGAAFLVAMHLSPGHESHLTEILRRHTALPVRTASQGMALEPGMVFVLPPGQAMTVEDGIVQLQPTPRGHRLAKAIDQLFGSVACNFGDRAMGVVLSGTGSDGALGARAIKERGGITLAQGADGSAPMFSGMPESAVAARAIDLQLPVEAIGPKLCEIIGSLRRSASPEAVAAKATAALRQRICELLEAAGRA